MHCLPLLAWLPAPSLYHCTLVGLKPSALPPLTPSITTTYTTQGCAVHNTRLCTTQGCAQHRAVLCTTQHKAVCCLASSHLDCRQPCQSSHRAHSALSSYSQRHRSPGAHHPRSLPSCPSAAPEAGSPPEQIPPPPAAATADCVLSARALILLVFPLSLLRIVGRWGEGWAACIGI